MKTPTLFGGPLDGMPITIDYWDFVVHTFGLGGQSMAVYELDCHGRFVFVGVRPFDAVANESEHGSDGGDQ